MKGKWTEYEINFLKSHYSTMDNRDICGVIHKSMDNIRHKAKALGLRKAGRRHDITLSYKLLDGTLESLYWIGFILADGHIDKNFRLSISLSKSDESHLEKLAKYLNVKVKNLPKKNDTKSKDSEFINLRASNKSDFMRIAELFDIRSNKTYNPPVFAGYKLTEDQWIALLIGFIDGDGCIQSHRRTKGNIALNIHINVHISWLNNLHHISDIIKKYTNIPTRMQPRIYKNMAKLDISNNQIICILKRFIVESNIPYLERKWNKIDHNMHHNRKYN